MPLVAATMLSSQFLFASCQGPSDNDGNNADTSDTTVNQPTVGVETDTAGETFVDTTETNNIDTTGTTTGM